MFNLLAVSEQLKLEGYPKDNVPLTEAGLYALLGFLIVFMGIAFLVGVVWLVGKFLTKGATVKKSNEPKKEEVVQSAPPVENEEEISEEVVAVITAAIMAYYESNNLKCEFTVRRIKRF